MIMVSVCLPSDASRNTYHLTWVSLTLDEGYLLTTAPPGLERGVAPLGSPAPAQPPLLGCVNYIAGGKLLFNTGNSTQCPVLT